jgi:hypothetical protein
VVVKRNLTIQLDEETIRDAKTIAAHRGMSVSGLMTQQIKHLVTEYHRYEQAKRGALELLAQVGRAADPAEPVTAPAQSSWRREDLYEERLSRYGR